MDRNVQHRHCSLHAVVLLQVARPVVSLFGAPKPKAAPVAPQHEDTAAVGAEGEEGGEGEAGDEEDVGEEEGEDGDEEEEEEEGEEEDAVPVMTFRLLMKRSGKDDRTRELQVGFITGFR